MDAYKTYIICPHCNGTGDSPNGEVDEFGVLKKCPTCNGDRYCLHGKVDGVEDIDWIKTKIKKILRKLDIPE